jgi:hypothetical protein
MPYPEYKNRDIAPGAIPGINHGVNDKVIKQRNIDAWKRASSLLPDDAFADDVHVSDYGTYRKGFSTQ